MRILKAGLSLHGAAGLPREQLQKGFPAEEKILSVEEERSLLGGD